MDGSQLAWVIYLVGLPISIGILGAVWGWDHGNSPAPFFASLVWPIVLPALLTQKIVESLMASSKRRQSLRQEEEQHARSLRELDETETRRALKELDKLL